MLFLGLFWAFPPRYSLIFVAAVGLSEVARYFSSIPNAKVRQFWHPL